MVSEIWRLHNKCGHISNIIVDSAKPEVISTLRREFRKDQYSDQYMRNIVADCKKYNTPIENRLFVVGKSFAVDGRQMLQHSVMLMDDPDGLVVIPSRYESLLIALRTPTATEWKLEKQVSLSNDLTDAFIMNLSYYRLSTK